MRKPKRSLESDPHDLAGSNPFHGSVVLKDDLLETHLTLVETHISWVFLGDREVWKVKKPVDLGFLDFSNSKKRRAACDAEVRLNRRLASDVYLGVVPVTRDASGRHRFGGDESQAVDWAVHMRRLPDTDRADVRIAEDRLTPDHMDIIARTIASFHAEARSDEETGRFGTVAAIRINVEENFAQTRATILAHLTATEAQPLKLQPTDFEPKRSLVDRGPLYLRGTNLVF